MKDWMKNEVFQKMDIQKQTMIELLSDALEGKKLTEALPVLMEWKKQMEKDNIHFTEEENRLLTDIFARQMTPAQRQQYEYLKHFITPKSSKK